MISCPTGGDNAKAIGSAGDCGTDAAAGGTSIVTNLGPDDSADATSATAAFTWTSLGQYKLCYQLSGGSYSDVAPLISVVTDQAPTTFSYDGAFPYQSVTVTFSGGSQLQLGDGKDAAKVVASSGACSQAAAGGTSVVTDLGPNDATSAVTAMAQFVFTAVGGYKVCYKPDGASSYAQVGGSELTVTGASAWSTNQALTTGTALTITFTGTGLKLGEGQDAAKAVHGDASCTGSDAAGGTVVVTNLGPDDSAGATSATAEFTFSIAGTYKLCYKPNSATNFGAFPITLTVLGTAPASLSIAGPTNTGSALTMTLSGGSGLALGSNQDAAKAVDGSSTCTSSSAGDSSEVLDLGPDNEVGATIATAQVKFSAAGVYYVCYKVEGGSYVQVGSSTLTVLGVSPSRFQLDMNPITIQAAVSVTVLGGSGLNLGAAQDALGIISSSGQCSETSLFTNTDTDLGPTDDADGTSAVAIFEFSTPGLYRLCYKLASSTVFTQASRHWSFLSFIDVFHLMIMRMSHPYLTGRFIHGSSTWYGTNILFRCWQPHCGYTRDFYIQWRRRAQSG